jgi:hypothetical protein
MEAGYDIRTIQELLGHGDVSTSMICARVLTRSGLGARSPLDGGRNGGGEGGYRGPGRRRGDEEE